jgi:acyl-CoA thioesterase-1
MNKQVCFLLLFVCGTYAITQISCVGDSITVAGYPAVLQTLLGNSYSVSNFGVSGTTMLKNGDSPYWNTGNYQAAIRSSPDIVIIMLGTNDAKPWNWVHAANYSVDYAAMIGIFKGLQRNPKIFINTPPPVYQDGQFGISQHNLNLVIVPDVHQISSQNEVGLIDVFNATGGLKLTDPSWFPDGIHPNGDGNTAIAKTVFQYIKQME